MKIKHDKTSTNFGRRTLGNISTDMSSKSSVGRVKGNTVPFRDMHGVPISSPHVDNSLVLHETNS